MKEKFNKRAIEVLVYLPPALVKDVGYICEELKISKSAFARTSMQHFVDMYRIRDAKAGGRVEEDDIDNFDYTQIAESYLRYETDWRK
jgi:hypothetical protein